jgi:hypothetical protein
VCPCVWIGADTEVYPYRIGLKRGEGFTCGGVGHTLP